VDIGKLRHKVIIKSVNGTDDGQGGETEGTPTTVATIWGNVKPMQGKRALEYGQIIGHKPYTITMNYRNDITIDNTSLFVYASRTFETHSVITIEEDFKQLEIICYEKK